MPAVKVLELQLSSSHIMNYNSEVSLIVSLSSVTSARHYILHSEFVQ